MIICPFCQTPHIDNTLFCDECGTYLLEEESRDTFPLLEDGDNDLSAQTERASTPNANKLKPYPHSPPVVTLTIHAPQKRWEIVMEKTVYLGRIDPTANIYPEIDFTEADGLGQGISRQHARLLYREGQLFIEDLGSINGSFLNGHRLMSYLPEALNDGDELMLGRMKIDVSVKI